MGSRFFGVMGFLCVSIGCQSSRMREFSGEMKKIMCLGTGSLFVVMVGM